MDASLLSLIDLIRNISLAVFAISTWYITHEEKRTRILFNLSLIVKDSSVRDLSEIIIELRDKKGVREHLGGQLKSSDMERLERKIDKLRKLDHTRNFSVITFSFSVFIEIAVFVYYSLFTFLN